MNELPGCPLFFNINFPWLFNDQKMKIHELSAQHIFLGKRYTTYECIPELVVTVPSVRSTIVKKIKRFIIWLYKWSRVTFTELLSAVVKIPWQYHHFPWLSMTFAVFHDFSGLENGLPKFHDFPWPGGTCHETRPPPPRVTVPNMVTLDEVVWVSKTRGTVGHWFHIPVPAYSGWMNEWMCMI